VSSAPSRGAPSITVLHDRLRPEEQLLFDALEQRGAHVERVYAPAWHWQAGAARREGETVLLRTLSHARTLAIARALEADGAQVINSAHVIEVCGDKAATTAALAAAGVPQPRTAIAFGRDEVLAIAENFGWPIVIKPVVGSWGRMISRLSDVDALDAVLEHKTHLGGPQHQVFYVQEHVNKPGRDLRAFVVGDRVVAAIAREGEDWRTNTARGAVVRGMPTGPMEEIALAAARAVGGGVLAVDLLESGSELLISEVNHGLEFRNSSAPTGVDIPGEIASYLIAQAERYAQHVS